MARVNRLMTRVSLVMNSPAALKSSAFGNLKIESCKLSDVRELLAIEKQCHEFPWTQDNFVTSFASGYVARKLLVKRSPVAFYVLHTLPKIQEATLMDICVHPQYQGKGIGRLLMQDIYSTLKKMDISTIFLEVRASNVTAIALYEKCGFTATGVRKDYYPAKKGREDAVLMMQEIVIDQAS